MAQRHQEFLDLGGRVYAISADTLRQNNAMVDKLALPFPVLSDPDRDRAVTPLGFADEDDPRQISRPGTVIIDPEGTIVFSVTGRDYADRPNEDDLLAELAKLELSPATQTAPVVNGLEPGPKAMPYEGLKYYFSGAKFATLAIRRRHREVGDEFRDDTKRYFQMIERYIDAMTLVEDRKA